MVNQHKTKQLFEKLDDNTLTTVKLIHNTESSSVEIEEIEIYSEKTLFSAIIKIQNSTYYVSGIDLHGETFTSELKHQNKVQSYINQKRPA